MNPALLQKSGIHRALSDKPRSSTMGVGKSDLWLRSAVACYCMQRQAVALLFSITALLSVPIWFYVIVLGPKT